MPEVILAGARIFYSECRPEKPLQGETILLVHGAGGSHKYWLSQVLQLGRRHRVLALDLPGHGLSGGGYLDTVDLFADLIHGFAREVIDGRFFMLGHSMGGAITMKFAALHESLLKGMVLVCTGARLKVHPALLESFRQGIHYVEMAPMLYREGMPDLEMIRLAASDMLLTPAAAWYNDFKACDGFDMMNEITGISVPALVVSAEHDRMTPGKYGRYLAATLPRAAFVEVSGAGHMIMLEKSGELNEAVERFVNETALESH